MMKHNNKRNMCKRLFFLGIFLDNIKVPPSQRKRPLHLGESQNTRYNTRYKPKCHAIGVLGTSILSSGVGFMLRLL